MDKLNNKEVNNILELNEISENEIDTNSLDELNDKEKINNILEQDEISEEEFDKENNNAKDNHKNGLKATTGTNLKMLSMTPAIQPFDAGGDADITFSLTNIGNMTASNTIVNIDLGSSYGLVGNVSLGNILSGYTYTYTITLNGIAAGSYNVKLTAVSSTLEIDLSDNAIEKVLNWAGIADLVVTSFMNPDDPINSSYYVATQSIPLV